MDTLTNHLVSVYPECQSPEIIAQCIYDYASSTYTPNVLGIKMYYIRDKLNETTIKQLIDGTLTVDDLFESSLYESSKHHAAIYKHTMNNREVIVVAGMRTYVCPRCKVRDQTIEEKQTRSLDESSTIKCVCNNCGKKWNGN